MEETISPYDESTAEIIDRVQNYQKRYQESLSNARVLSSSTVSAGVIDRGVVSTFSTSSSVVTSTTLPSSSSSLFFLPSHDNILPSSSSLSSISSLSLPFRKPRAFVTVTYAQSIDGSLSTGKGYQTSLSCSDTLRITHDLRTIHQGILIGIGTLITDNPSLTARLATRRYCRTYDATTHTLVSETDYPLNHPQPILLDPTFDTPLECKLLMEKKCRRPIIFILQSYYDTYIVDKKDPLIMEKYNAVLGTGARIYPVPSVSSRRNYLTEDTINTSSKNEIIMSSIHPSKDYLDLYRAMEIVYENEHIHSVMVEGGATVHGHYFHQHNLLSPSLGPLIQCIIVTIAPMMIPGGLHIPYPTPDSQISAEKTAVDSTDISRISTALPTRKVREPSPVFRLSTFHWIPVGKDMIIIGTL